MLGHDPGQAEPRHPQRAEQALRWVPAPTEKGGMCPNDKAECLKNFTYTQLPAGKRNNTRKQERKGRAPACAEGHGLNSESGYQRSKSGDFKE